MRRLTPGVLEDLPNIGPSIAGNLRQIGICQPVDLVGEKPDELYRAVCEATGHRQDPCLLDVFISSVRFMEGERPRPWWHYTAERKKRYAVVTGQPAERLTRSQRARAQRRAAGPTPNSQRG